MMIRAGQYVNLTGCHELFVGEVVSSNGYYYNSAVLSSDDQLAGQSVNLVLCHKFLVVRIVGSRGYYCNSAILWSVDRGR